MSDDALLEIDPEDLTPDAQACLDAELDDRGLGFEGDSPAPEWIDDSISICSFIANPGGTAMKEAGAACEALKSAGIPSHIASEEVGDPPRRELRVMVPSGRTLEATSVLDKSIFNPEAEADWRAHLEGLSPEDFAAIDPEVICAGFLDRAARLKHAYDDEFARRFPPDE
jgi:hypothetical protein